MLRVSDIKRAPRRSGAFTVTLDDGQSFDMSDLELSTSALRVGCELTNDEVQGYMAASDMFRAYDLATRFLMVRPRSRREVATHLRGKHLEDAAIQDACERLADAGLIDDRRFAEAWIASRQAQRPRSGRHLAGELMGKGVSREIVDEVLDGRGPEDEEEALVALARKKLKLSQYRQPQKLTMYLVRQGYEYGLVKRIVDQIQTEPSE